MFIIWRRDKNVHPSVSNSTLQSPLGRIHSALGLIAGGGGFGSPSVTPGLEFEFASQLAEGTLGLADELA